MLGVEGCNFYSYTLGKELYLQSLLQGRVYFPYVLLQGTCLFISNNTLKKKAGHIVILHRRLHGQLLHSRKEFVFHYFTPGKGTPDTGRIEPSGPASLYSSVQSTPTPPSPHTHHGSKGIASENKTTAILRVWHLYHLYQPCDLRGQVKA